jgi:RNA polymerase sigma factor (sigma-70 family)
LAETTAETITATWREESARLVGALTRMTRNLDLAEELAQDALVSALESWPIHGIPDNPGAWLMTTAKRRAVDSFRRADNLRRKTEELGHGLSEEDGMSDLTAHVDFIEDDVLRLIFLSCHPQLTAESRAALTLRLVPGLTTAEIARAFLVPEATVAQRIVRAKRTLAAARVPFEVPTGADRDARLSSVLEVVYAIFNSDIQLGPVRQSGTGQATTESLRAPVASGRAVRPTHECDALVAPAGQVRDSGRRACPSIHVDPRMRGGDLGTTKGDERNIHRSQGADPLVAVIDL